MFLEVNDLRVVFGGLVAVNDVSCHVEQGSVFGIIGPNGAGKSTFFNALAGVVPTRSGSIDGAALDRLPPSERVRKGLARTFQAAQYFESMTVLDNVIVARHAFANRSVVHCLLRTPTLRRSDAAETERAQEILASTGLAHAADRYVSELSILQRQRLVIALALATEPSLLMLDEPLAGLAPTDVNEFSDLLRQVSGQGITLLFIEHRLRALMALCDRIMVLEQGTKIAEGTPAEIRNDENVVRAYLGASYAA